MKSVVLIALSAVSIVAYAVPKDKRINGENGWYVPHIDGSFEWIDMNEKKNYFTREQTTDGRLLPSPVTFYLYTKETAKADQVIFPSRKSIDASSFNAQNPTRISIHGWTGNKNDFINYGVRKAWLSKGKYNFIFVDWGRARSLDYASSTYAVEDVGKQVASLVDFLVANYGLKLDTVEIIGHSLGAHVAGFTGKNIKSGKVHSIVGLDPAFPLFSYNNPNKRLSSTDASYVETIQTNGGKLGFLKPIGRAAFYPNGGKLQPGCKSDLTGACSHSRSIVYYVEAVQMNNFIGIACENYKDAVAANCSSTYTAVHMGNTVNAHSVSGTFFVPVNHEAPYGKID